MEEEGTGPFAADSPCSPTSQNIDYTYSDNTKHFGRLLTVHGRVHVVAFGQQRRLGVNDQGLQQITMLHKAHSIIPVFTLLYQPQYNSHHQPDQPDQTRPGGFMHLRTTNTPGLIETSHRLLCVTPTTRLSDLTSTNQAPTTSSIHPSTTTPDLSHHW